MSDEVRWVAIYERVSSDDQRERETIKTQTDVIDRYLAMHPNVRVYRRYRDDGVSGTIPMNQRPAGKRLLEDAMNGRFTEIWVTRPDRLGRNEIDLLQLYALLEGLGVELVGIAEPIGDRFVYGIHAVVSAANRRRFLAQSAEGMARAARDGRYCGGIVPLGYKVEGKKQTARLVPSDIVMWRTWTEADVVIQIYGWLVEGWSCRKIADHLSALGVPTVYSKDDRCVKERVGKRKKRTQGVWRAGRIRNLVVNPVYKGEYHYGRRRTRPSSQEPIVAAVPPLVSPEVWGAAKETLARNRIMAKGATRTYVLRSVIRCGLCGLTYSGTVGRNVVWYRCNGQIVGRGKHEGRCKAKSIRGDCLVPLVWGDCVRFLLEPGDIIEELTAELNQTSEAALTEAERQLVEDALGNISGQRDRIIDVYRRGRITADEFDSQMESIGDEEETLRRRLADLVPTEPPTQDMPSEELLSGVRRRLNEGVDDGMRQEIVSLLVRRITVKTEEANGTKRATLIIEYRFPAVANFSTGRGSSLPPS